MIFALFGQGSGFKNGWYIGLSSCILRTNIMQDGATVGGGTSLVETSYAARHGRGFYSTVTADAKNVDNCIQTFPSQEKLVNNNNFLAGHARCRTHPRVCRLNLVRPWTLSPEQRCSTTWY